MRHDEDQYEDVSPDVCPDCGERINPMHLPGLGWVTCACDVPAETMTKAEYYRSVEAQGGG